MAYARPLSQIPHDRRPAGRSRLGAVTATTATTTAPQTGTTAQTASSLAQTAQTASSLLATVEGIFDPGKTRDQQRQARVNFFLQAALLGSVVAARYLIGGTQNTGSNETAQYTTAISQLQGDPRGVGPQIYQQAAGLGSLWAAGIPDPAGTQSMVNAVNADLTQLGQHTEAAPAGWNVTSSSPAGGGFSTSGMAHPLPGMTTTAPYNWTPILIGGAVVALALGTMRKRS